MNSIRIEKKDIYTIEVNDNGDTIEFDLADIELPFKFQRAIDGIKTLRQELKGKLIVIDKKKDHKGKDEFMTDNEKARLELYKETFLKMRACMDEFLGVGACQKIFGDRNYLTMYDDLFEELDKKGEDGLSHLDKMSLTSKGIIDRIEKKYKPQNDGSILK